MSKHIQLSISDPCHENWDNMTSVEKGKFCGSCQKQVVDFTNMSDREVAQFFKKPSTGSVCGRFMQDQLGRSIEIPKKRIPWVKYFFQFALPAFLVSMKATAQGKVKVNTSSNISLMQKTTGSQITLQKDYNFQDTITLPEVVIISNIQVMGKLTTRSMTQIVEDTTVLLQSQDQLGIIAGGISVCRYSDFKWPKDSIVKQVLKKLLPDNFKVYPNPVKAGTSIHMEWKQKTTGDFMLQLLNVSGQLIFIKQLRIDEEARLLEFQLPSVAAGNYFLRMTNKQSGKNYTEKIIIQ
ncbi:MAG: T9SS type A sorting domain-containing protein [Bacteroidota bacterium]